MGNMLHPIMQAAIAPFIKLPHKLRRIPGTQTFRYTLVGVDLTCEIEWEAGEKRTLDDPGYPANAILCSAETSGGDDIAELLSIEQQGEIETAFLNQKQEY